MPIRAGKERYGTIGQHSDGLDFDWLVISSALTEALNRDNYDRTKTLARMFDEGIVVERTKGYVRQRRIGESAHRTYCVSIDNNALEKFVADHAPRLTGSPKAEWRHPYAHARKGLLSDTERDGKTGGKAAGQARPARIVGHESAGNPSSQEVGIFDWDDERELRRVPWTEDEDDIIRELSHKGAVAIAYKIWDRLGIERRPHSVECRASKLHRNLRRLAQCPMCGAIGVHLNRQTGLCRGCNESYRLEEERVYHEQLELERWEAEEGPDVERIMKEREALRQRNARLRRKYHLKDKQQRKRNN